MQVMSCLVFFLVANVACANDKNLPPRSEWRATSSSMTTPAMSPAHAIDGDLTTRWGGGFSPGNWFQVDLGRAADVGGVIIHWDYGAAKAYSIQDSIDGQHWHTAFETTDATAGTEYIVFPAVHTRFVRLASPARTADWGASLFEFEPLSAHDSPRIRGVGDETTSAQLWLGTTPRSISSTHTFTVDLPHALDVAGLEIFWSTSPASTKLEARSSDGRWQVIDDDPLPAGDVSFLAAPKAATYTALRVTVRDADRASAITRIRLLSPTRTLTPMKRYEIAASRANQSLFPSSLHQQQVYWTAVGIPGGLQKSVIDEYGDIEAFKTAPLVQPVWRDDSGRASAAFDSKITHTLRDGWMPMPSARWSPQPGLELTSEAFAIEQNGQPVTLVRHRLVNRGTTKIDGVLALLIRPMQISPPWQNGGPSPIRDIAVDATSARVNGRLLFDAVTPPDAQGAAPFGAHGETEVTRTIATGNLPPATAAHDDDGLAAAAFTYRTHLAPGEHRDVVVAFPLGRDRLDVKTLRLPDAPALDVSTLGDFDALADKTAAIWQSRLGKIGLSLPDPSLVDMLRAQAAYMLINQTGPAMQPGPRNYNRSFIRDGAATAAALLRIGLAQTARDYLRWYSDHAVHDNGLVSPILNDDGTVNTGFGSDIEYDSQGEYIWLVAETARLDGGAQTVRDYQPKVKRALQFLQTLRERTLVPGYASDREAPERFRGIIAPSISHEGYPTPTHSYWDDYWALKGWHDGAWLAEQWADKETAAWAREQYQLLHDSLAASIRATMAWKHSDVIPASADLGDPDPTSVSIALDPCGAQDVLPPDALARTFEQYLGDVRKRYAPDALYAYTPYEMRNVLTYVHLNRPDEANELLGDLLAHRRPLEWQVLAEVVYSDPRHAIYLGDMPHTWIGAEYARALFGMLMHEGDRALTLLPGAPPAWLDGDGVRVTGLPTSYGSLSMSAKRDGAKLVVHLDAGLRTDAALDSDLALAQATVIGARRRQERQGFRRQRNPAREAIQGTHRNVVTNCGWSGTRANGIIIDKAFDEDEHHGIA